MEQSKKKREKLVKIKEDINQSAKYFKENVNRYKEFIKFVYETSLTQADRVSLEELKKPQLEFNVLEAYISRLIGDFQENEPDLQVSAADGVPIQMLTQGFIDTIKVIEAHTREALDSAANDGLRTKLMKDMLAGGYSVARVYTDYINEMSFEQEIKIERVFDPTLTGFDPMARESHRGDGRYCFEIIPHTKEEFEDEFGAEACKNAKFTRSSNNAEFDWSYKNQDQDILMVVDYYERVKKKETVVKMTNGAVILKKHVPEITAMIASQGLIVQPPSIVEERKTTIETIVRYRVCEDKVLDYVVTNFKFLPLVFFDGNGTIIYDSNSGESQLMTRPYVYHAKGIQRLKNFAGQTVACEIENMKMTQWKVALESIPKKYLTGYTNPQKLQSLIYHAFDTKNPDKALPPPMEAQRTPTPVIVQETFMGSDAVTQVILGSYDAQQGHIGAKDLSGKAIMMGSMQSSSASLPYAIGYINGMNRIAQTYIDLVPKYYVTPRTLPVKKANGKREYVVINDKADEQSILMNYDPNHLNVKLELGVNSAMQKQISLETIIGLMGSSELFSEFMNTNGLEVLLENIDIRGVDELKVMAKNFMEQKQQQAEADSNEGSDTDKIVEAEKEIEGAKIEQRREEAEGKLSVETAKAVIEEQKAYTEFMKMYYEIEQKARAQDLEQQKVMAENARAAIEASMSLTQSRLRGE